MSKLTVSQFAKSLTPPVSRQRINELCNRGDLVRADGFVDTENPKNARWLKFREEAPDPTRPSGRWGPRPDHDTASDLTDGEGMTEEEATSALADMLKKIDIRSIAYHDVQKVQKIEQALKTRIEREHKRGDLIDRVLIKSVFAQLYQVDSQQLRMLGARLAPDVSGILGIDDPTLVLMVEARIEGEVLKALTHIKRIINEFLESIGTNGIE